MGVFKCSTPHPLCGCGILTVNLQNFFNEIFSKSNSRKFRLTKYKCHTVGNCQVNTSILLDLGMSMSVWVRGSGFERLGSSVWVGGSWLNNLDVLDAVCVCVSQCSLTSCLFAISSTLSFTVYALTEKEGLETLATLLGTKASEVTCSSHLSNLIRTTAVASFPGHLPVAHASHM